MKRYKSDSAVNQAKISKHRSTTKATQYEAAANKFYKIFIILFLLIVTIALIYIVILLKIEIIPAILQLKYNNNDVNNNDTELTLPQIIQENKQVDIASPVLDSWIAHLNISYNDTAPIILKIPNFAEKVNNNDIWYSEPFFAFERGYQMVLGLDAAGSHRGRGSHMSVYIFLSKGPYDDELEQSGHWPMIGSFLIELLNQHNDSLHHSKIIWFAKLCSHCSNRVLNATKIIGYGHDRFISLEVLKNKTLYHENDNIYFRVSFSTCRSCVLLMDSINTIGALVLLSALDICAIIVLLVCVEVYKSLKETSKLVFGLQLNHAMVSNAVFKETCRFYVLVAIAGVVENLPFVLWELTDFISSDVASILEDSINRFIYFFAFYGIVSVYTITNKNYIVVKPLLLFVSLASASHANFISILFVLFVNAFLILYT